MKQFLFLTFLCVIAVDGQAATWSCRVSKWNGEHTKSVTLKTFDGNCTGLTLTEVPLTNDNLVRVGVGPFTEPPSPDCACGVRVRFYAKEIENGGITNCSTLPAKTSSTNQIEGIDYTAECEIDP